MSGPPHLLIRQNRPWRLRVLSWKDENGNTQDPSAFAWRFVATTQPPLDVIGAVATGVVTFALNAAATQALTPGRNLDYAVKATPLAGGDANYVLEGHATVERTAL